MDDHPLSTVASLRMIHGSGRPTLLAPADSDDDSDGDDIDYAIILQGLINRYTNSSLMPAQYADIRNYRPPPPDIAQDKKCYLLKSEFALSTQNASGAGALKRKWPRNNVANILAAREKGIPLSSNFSYSDKCKINNKYLPNDMELLQKHNGKVFCGIFSGDGDYFMTASQDRQINIFDSKCGAYKKINKIRAREVEWSVIDVAFSPNNQHIVYSTWAPFLQLCSIHDSSDKQEMLRLINGVGRFCAFSVVYSSSGDEVLAAANDGCIYIYDLEKHQRSLRIMAHAFDVNTIALATESSQIIYSGGDDGLIKVWDRRTLTGAAPKPVGTLAGHLDGVTYIDSRGDGRHLISNSKDQSIKLWDVRLFSSHSAAENTVKQVKEQPWDYRWQDVPRKLYKNKKLEGDTSIMTYKGHVVIKTLVRCRFSPAATTGQRYIYTGCGLGRVIIYDTLTGKIVRQLAGHNGTVRDVAWHPYRNELVSSSWDGLVGCWKYGLSENWYSSDEEDDPTNEKQTRIIRRSARLAQKRRRKQ